MSKEVIAISEIIEEMIRDRNISRSIAEEFVKVLLSSIQDALIEGDSVKIKALGTFRTGWKDENSYFDQGKEREITVPGFYNVLFTPIDEFKNAVNEPFAHLEPVTVPRKAETPKNKEKIESDNEDIAEPFKLLEEQVVEIKDLLHQLGAIPKENKEEEMPLDGTENELTTDDDSDFVDDIDDVYGEINIEEDDDDVSFDDKETDTDIDIDIDIDKTETSYEPPKVVTEIPPLIEHDTDKLFGTPDEEIEQIDLTTDEEFDFTDFDIVRVVEKETDREQENISDSVRQLVETKNNDAKPTIDNESVLIDDGKVDDAEQLVDETEELKIKSSAHQPVSSDVENKNVLQEQGDAEIEEQLTATGQDEIIDQNLLEDVKEDCRELPNEAVEDEKTTCQDDDHPKEDVLSEDTAFEIKKDKTDIAPVDVQGKEEITSDSNELFECETDGEDEPKKKQSSSLKLNLLLVVLLFIGVAAAIIFLPKIKKNSQLLKEKKRIEFIADSLAVQQRIDQIAKEIAPTLIEYENSDSLALENTADSTNRVSENELESRGADEVADPFNSPREYSEFIGTESIKKGSQLANIARKYYGHGYFWVYIYEANKEKIKNPNNVPIGVELQIPKVNSALIDPQSKRALDYAQKLQSQYLQ